LPNGVNQTENYFVFTKDARFFRSAQAFYSFVITNFHLPYGQKLKDIKQALRRPSVMGDWKTARLGDVCTIKYGKDHKRLADGNIPVYGSGGVIRYADTALYGKKSVLIPRKGSLNNLYFVETPFWTVDTLFYTKINESLVTPEFLYYQLLTLDLAGMNVGTAVPSLTTAILNEVEVILPPMEEQMKIGRILRLLDDKIANNAKINNYLEQMAPVIFKSWFVDFEPWGGVMPEGWREMEFSSFLAPRVERIICDDSVLMLSVTNNGVMPRHEKFDKNLASSSTKVKLAKYSDIVFGNSRHTLNWGVVRVPAGGVSSVYNVFSVADDVCIDYLESFMKAKIGYFSNIIRSTTRDNQSIDIAALMQKKLYLPSSEILKEYYAVALPLAEAIRTRQSESTRLATLRDALLPRLMSGELSVAVSMEI
jgi:type I restriction enzyme S subunit